ncbi:MAG TPA: glycoside hydrolase domain-containing protein [Polyangiaceae bacterium]
MSPGRSAAGMVGMAAVLLAPRLAGAEPVAWVVDDGEKLARTAHDTPFERGELNPVWSPGEPVRLVAMKNETVAFQVVVGADDEDLEDVTVELPELTAESAPKTDKGETPTIHAARIERFVEHFVDVWRPSHGKDASASRGWEAGSGPPDGAWTGRMPDALIPVLQAPHWEPYPMKVPAHVDGVVWIDVGVERDQPPGLYTGTVTVSTSAGPLRTFPVELEVADMLLPDRTVKTAARYDAKAVMQRVGYQAERNLWQLLRAHRVTPVHEVSTPSDVDRQAGALSGEVYSRGYGYSGPAPAMGDDVIFLGGFGEMGEPDEGTLGRIRALVAEAKRDKVLGAAEMVLPVAKDKCSSPWAVGWRRLLRETEDPDLVRIRVGWACTQDPTAQPVAVPMLEATFDPLQVSAARAQGKETWVYGGVLPRTGTFLLDADAVSPRVNGWLAAMYDVPRWLVMDTTRWTLPDPDDTIDPFQEVETLDGKDGEWANGEGMLVYPGAQRDGLTMSFQGVVPSIRLKNWRRGLQDAGYLQLARARNRSAADAVARWLVPSAFGEARHGDPASWGPHGDRFFEARRALLDIALGRATVDLGKPDATPTPIAARAAKDLFAPQAASCVMLSLVGLLGTRRLRRRRHPVAPGSA